MKQLSKEEKINAFKHYFKFVCHICKYDAKDDVTKSKHKKSHRDFKITDDFKCLECEKKFKTVKDLKGHYTVRHKLLFDCLFCNAKNTRKSSSVKHMKRWHLKK